MKWDPSFDHKKTAKGMVHIILLLLLLSQFMGCVASSSHSTRVEEALPDHPALVRHTLASGTEMWILPRAGEAVELRLVVNAGSVHEAPDQLGIAHLVEHMAFRGTAAYPAAEAQAELAAQGLNLGSHVNAVTSFFNTTYRLSLPNAEALPVALHLMAQWANAITFDAEALAGEQLIVQEEWRLRQSGGTRINQQLDAVRYQGSLLAEREPIGDLTQVLGFDRDALLAFYQQWYRPERMTLILVGAVDVQQVIAQAEADFAAEQFTLSPAGAPLSNVDLAAFPAASAAPLVAAVLDPEQGQRFVQVMLQRPQPAPLTQVNGQFRDLIDQLWLEILTHRFNQRVEQGDLARGQTSPFGQLLTPDFQHYLLILHPQQGNYAQAVEVAAQELARLMQHPVLDEELHAAKQRLLHQRGDQARFAAAVPPARLAERLANAAVYQLPVLSEAQEFELTQQLLSGISAAHLQAALLELEAQAQVKLALIGPSSDAEPIAATDFAALWQQTLARPQSPWVMQQAAVASLPALVQAPLVQRRQLPALSTEGARTERLTLSNGMTLLWRQDPALDAQLHLDVRFPGGRSLEAEHGPAWVFWSMMLPEACGYGDISAADVARFARTHQLQVRPYVEELHHGFRASASPAQLEPLLQVLQLKMAAPRYCEAGLVRWREQLQQQQQHQPVEQSFAQQLQALAFESGHLMQPAALLQQLDALPLEQLAEQRERLFAQASAGRIGLASRPLPEQLQVRLPAWLAALHTSDAPAITWQDRGLRPVAQSMQASWPINLSPKTQVQIHYSQPTHWSAERQIALELLETWVHQRLQARLRQDLSGVYSFGMHHLLARDPEAYYLGRLNFSSAPERAEELIEAALQEIAQLRQTPPTAAEWRQAQETWRLGLAEREAQAAYWSAALAQTQTPAQEEQLALAAGQAAALSAERAHALFVEWLAGPVKIFQLTPRREEG